MASTDNWLPMTPELDPSGTAFSTLANFLEKLKSHTGAPNRQILGKWKQQALDGLEEDSQEFDILRVCVFALGDLHAQGWNFKTKDRVLMLRPPRGRQRPER